MTRRRLLLSVSLLAALVLVAFWGHWQGDFVYDDVQQIAGNPSLRTGAATLRALSRDVWAFKGERAEAWSNYWRPAFVGWLAVNYRLFGLDSTAGWHWSAVGLHLLASCLALQLLARVGFPFPVALAAAAIFAVHPVHLESVAWISGSPDVLASCFLLASFLVLPRGGDDAAPLRWTCSLALYALALLTKEVAVLAPVLVLAFDRASNDSATWRQSLVRAAPFAAAASIFLVVRRLILGLHEIEVPWHLEWWQVALTLPRLLAFYSRQLFWPLELGPSYPLRAVTSGISPVAVAQLIATLCLAALVVASTRGNRVLQFALCLAILPLLPAMNINAFIPEQIVHDRYLYLPVLGAWAAVLLAANDGARRLGVERQRLWAALGVTGLVLLLAVQSQRNVAIWSSELNLWTRGVKTDPGSAFNWAHLGLAQSAAGDVAAAAVSFDRSLAIVETPPALMGRAQIYAARGELELAEEDLERIVAAQPENSAAVERLAALYQVSGRMDRARDTLLAARDRIPHRRCVFTAGLGVVHYLSGDREAALRELEALRPLVTSESLPPCQLGLFQLAVLYLEIDRPDDARSALEEFVAVSQRSPHAVVGLRRRQAQARLSLLAGGVSDRR